MTQQRRMVLGLVVMAAFALALTLYFGPPPPEPDPAAAVSVVETDHSTMAQDTVRLSPGHVQPIDRRAPPDTETNDAAAPTRTLDDATAAMAGCVALWRDVLAVDDALQGELKIEVHFGASGVEQAAVLDAEGLPDAMLGCLGGVIYMPKTDWPGQDSAVLHIPIAGVTAEQP